MSFADGALDIRKKNKDVAVDEMKSVMPNFRILGQPVTSSPQVMSNPQNR